MMGVVGGAMVGIFGCQIYIGCSETKLLICHKGGFIIYGIIYGGGRWGGVGVDWVIHKPCVSTKRAVAVFYDVVHKIF